MVKSVVHLLLNSIQQFAEKDAFLHKVDGKYTGISYKEVGDMIEKVACALEARGLQAGNKIAILSYNRPTWPICDFAIFSIRAVTVPIYHTLPPSQIKYILKDAKVRAVFVENQDQLAKVEEVRQDCPDLEFIFTFDNCESENSELISWENLLSSGHDYREQDPEFFQTSIEAIEPTEICSLVYTSGTTGPPKGVMLHHKGFLIDIINSESVFGLYPEDIFLSFLPLSHLYERLGGHWCPLYRGCTIAYAEDITTVIDDIQKVRPTVMVSVPRVYEKISNAVMDQVEAGSPLKKKIFYWALDNGRRFQQIKRKRVPGKFLTFKNSIAESFVFSKVKQKLGGRFRFPISGGAPLSTETLKFFEAMGLQIVEGYGMTETHLIISLTPPGSTKYGSCGKPIPEVSIKIADDGEILVSGETLMAGYFNQPEQTAEMIDDDGWLHTGDIGFLDEDNYLYITDRKKNIIVTAGGKNIAPAPIEHTLKLSRYVDDACVIGDKRKFISAIIVPNFDNLKKWGQSQNLSFDNQRELVNLPEVSKLIETDLENLQGDTASYERIKKFHLLSDPLTIESGQLTPSLKIKRQIVEKHFRQEIELMYTESENKQT